MFNTLSAAKNTLGQQSVMFGLIAWGTALGMALVTWSGAALAQGNTSATAWRNAPLPELADLGRGSTSRSAVPERALTFIREWTRLPRGASTWDPVDAAVLTTLSSRASGRRFALMEPHFEGFDEGEGFASTGWGEGSDLETAVSNAMAQRLPHPELLPVRLRDGWATLWWDLHDGNPWEIRLREDEAMALPLRATAQRGSALDERIDVRARLRAVGVGRGHGMHAALAVIDGRSGLRLHVDASRGAETMAHTFTQRVDGGVPTTLDVGLTYLENGPDDMAGNGISVLIGGEAAATWWEAEEGRDARESVSYLEWVRVPVSERSDPIHMRAMTFLAAAALPSDWSPFVEAGEVRMRLAGVETLADRLGAQTDAMPVWLVYEVGLEGNAVDALGGDAGAVVVQGVWDGRRFVLRHRQAMLLDSYDASVSVRAFEVTEDGRSALLLTRSNARNANFGGIFFRFSPEMEIVAASDGANLPQLESGDPRQALQRVKDLFLTPSGELGILSSVAIPLMNSTWATTSRVLEPELDEADSSLRLPAASSSETPVAAESEQETPPEASVSDELPLPRIEASRESALGVDVEAFFEFTRGFADFEAIETYFRMPEPCPELAPLPPRASYEEMLAFRESHTARSACYEDRFAAYEVVRVELGEEAERLYGLTWSLHTQGDQQHDRYARRWNTAIDRFEEEARAAKKVIEAMAADLEEGRAAYLQQLGQTSP